MLFFPTVPHRLSTIQNCDCIAVVEKGKVAEKGSHAYLSTRERRRLDINLHECMFIQRIN